MQHVESTELDETTRTLLDGLLHESKLYKQSKDYLELLEFAVRLRNFAPFNAMLLHVQKPGMRFAASARDWLARFNRIPKEDARPLLIMWPFGPVALVYDLDDTIGDELPEDVENAFSAHGFLSARQAGDFVRLLRSKNILTKYMDWGDAKAGCIRRYNISEGDRTVYELLVNKNHNKAVQFATLAHELGHLFLGHLGPDISLKIPDRGAIEHERRELEAESVAYIVCARNGVSSKSESYLTNYVNQHTTIDHVDVYQIMRAAGQVESILKLTAHTRFNRPQVSETEDLFD